jgi:arylsulfatase A-like enzyme
MMNQATTRRSLLKGAAAFGIAAAFGRHELGLGRAQARPNVLLLITDQQCWNMMSCVGNRWLKTPAIDSLAAAGVRYELAYVTNPVCSPSRFSLQTGRMPSAAKISDNEDAPWGQVACSMLETSLGPLFHKAGYDAVYGGKTHLPRAFRDEFAGRSYRYFEENERDHLAKACAAYLKGPHERPFFLTASLINPHDICFLAINAYLVSQGRPTIFDEVDTSGELLRQMRDIKDRAAFFAKECPPLPANHGIPALEPEAIAKKYMGEPWIGPFRAYVREHWTDEDWRIYSWIYHRLTERVDGEVGSILAALREEGLEQSTLVILTSDHGDMNAAHKLEHKSVLYEEAMRVPFIMSYKGVIPEGRVDQTHLVSTGLDLLPTLCDYAGIELPPVALDGRSLRSHVEDHTPKGWRSYLVVESQHDRMVRTERFKYCRYSCGAHHEQLNDLATDPGEMNNLAEQPEYRDMLKKHQDLLNEWEKRTWDYDAEAIKNECAQEP